MNIVSKTLINITLFTLLITVNTFAMDLKMPELPSIPELPKSKELEPNKNMEDINKNFNDNFKKIGEEGYGKDFKFKTPEIENEEVPWKDNKVEGLHKEKFGDIQNKKLEEQHIIPKDNFFNTYMDSLKVEKNKLEALQKADSRKVKSSPSLSGVQQFDLNTMKNNFKNKVPSTKDIQNHIDNVENPVGYGTASNKIDSRKWDAGIIDRSGRFLTDMTTNKNMWKESAKRKFSLKSPGKLIEGYLKNGRP